ncbi:MULTISPECIES: amino acid ABC transporter permease [Mesorhizobium]|uniref:amino acid ABC transporter permease n=1 Tax=Mesorhizobium TaxID=68287 RepID=UPI0010A95655|nr:MULTISPECIES: ABC transporter permease subunit [Mesorhizobium]
MNLSGRFRSLLYQALFAVALLIAMLVLAAPIIDNVRQGGAGFDVLWRPANFNFGESLIPTGPSDTYGKALLVAFANTLWVSFIACILATVLGVSIAIAGYSRLVILRRVVSVYVEVFRNTPLLLQLLLWYSVLQSLPSLRQAIQIGDVFISQRGIALPSLSVSPQSQIVISAGALALVLVSWLPALTRKPGPRKALWMIALAVIVGAFLLGLSAEAPQLEGFNFRGGWRISPEFLAMVIGITLYSAAFISEIVRSGIDAVPKGQWEASYALGLGRLRCMHLVVLPQATRVSIPPLVSEYAGIVKNSSLAVAIGYPDLIWASSTAITQTGQAVQIVVIVMGLYLTVSTSISIVLNVLNRRMMRRYD